MCFGAAAIRAFGVPAAAPLLWAPANEKGVEMTEKTEKRRPQEKGWLTPEEAVGYSGIGRTRLYRYLIAGEVPSAKLGRTRHIKRADLDRSWSQRLDEAFGEGQGTDTPAPLARTDRRSRHR